MRELYLDGAATTKPSEDCLKWFNETSTKIYGNPSSTNYNLSDKANELLNIAREAIANTINANANEIYFTSGATEGANWAIQGLIPRSMEHRYQLCVSRIEHPCVYNTALHMREGGVTVNYIDVDGLGRLSLSCLDDIIYYCREDRGRIPIVCVMLANNETGVIQDIRQISKLVHEHDGYLICDCTQAYTHMQIDVQDLGIDIMFASGHKFHALRGTGFLYCKEGVPLRPLFYGGSQENGLRAGTENVAGIISMAIQAETECNDMFNTLQYISDIRHYLIDKLLNTFNVELGFCGLRHIVSVSFPDMNITASQLVSLLGERSIYCSAGSACSSGEDKPSRILKAMGYSDDLARKTLRITLDKDITKSDIDYFISELNSIINIL